ncbi:hypothetical protein M8J77_007414 [Diaphorina citri]|nr:hypothetical protein M8J77_007414 [Diaphorina citri]
MKLVIEEAHDQYGSAIFVKPDLKVVSAHLTNTRNIEILTIELPSCSVTSVYKPPNEPFEFVEPTNFNTKNVKIVMGDFNCHNIAWGYRTSNEDGEQLELWAERKDLKLLHDSKLPASFYSARWKRSYNPDNIFVSESILQQSLKKVEDPIPKTQHRPISCHITTVIRVDKVPFKRRFNFKKAKWNLFSDHLDKEIVNINTDCDSYDDFVNLVHKISRKYIPRGCRTTYIPGLDESSKELLEKYKTLFEEDPFSEETIQTGEDLVNNISQVRRSRWGNLLENMDMKSNSRRAWRMIKNLSNDPTKPKEVITNVTANQIAHQLLLNGKVKGKVKGTKLKRNNMEENDFMSEPFTMNELKEGINQLKTNKAAGLDEIRTEQIKYFGIETTKWLLRFYNNCISELKIPKIWRKAHVVALLKPGKDSDSPKNFRPVSLLCHLYKLLERLILNRISSYIDEKLIKEQAGFRPGKSCCGQILNLTQHIEDGYEAKKITGVAFIDLSAAYDTVNHRKLVKKVYELTRDFKLAKLIECILANRRFHVTLGNEKSRWRSQKNGLPQGSVISPILYNIYTNDQPYLPNTRKFIYADDTAIAAQENNFEEVEERLTEALSEMSIYYKENHLRPNPSKTQVCSFHLRNRDADRKLKVSWEGENLENCATPKYLGIKMDRTLSYKTHCKDTKMKVMARNNIIRKLTGTTWGAKPETLRTSTIALCLSTAEYAAPVWKNSSHTKEVDVAINAAARIVSGCLKPSPIEKIYPIIGIAPPRIRREVISEIERKKQTEDERHPLHGHIAYAPRLKSRKSFLRTTKPVMTSTEARKEELWKQATNGRENCKEELSPGFNLPYTTWKTLNRLRVGVSRCKKTLAKWGYSEEIQGDLCDCGETQDEAHLLVCTNIGTTCTKQDLYDCTPAAITVAEFWRKII